MPTEDVAAVRAAKRRLRTTLLAARGSRSHNERTSAATAFCARTLTLPELKSARTVGCYVSTSQEPDTAALLDALSRRGLRVLLPLLQSDFGLDWACYEPGRLRPARYGIDEPTGAPLGPDAITEAEVVVTPALAVDLRGNRLGRGGGSYDRALARLSNSTLRAVLVYDDEVLADVPVDAHDQRVQVAITPTRTLRLGA